MAAALSLPLCCQAQDAQPSLADVARNTRKEHASASHVPAKQVTNEEEDGPDAGGVWRVRLCSRTPCYELAIALPKSPKWIRPSAEPRPMLIPLLGHEDDLSHAIRVYAGESLGPPYPSPTFPSPGWPSRMYMPLDIAKKAFLQGLFARPEYFGAAARLLLDEHVDLETGPATITHFTVVSAGIKFRGLGIIANTGNGDYGFACAFRDEDANAANSICDAVVRSARSQVLEPSRPHVYPTYYPPVYYPRVDDPRIDPDDDPE